MSEAVKTQPQRCGVIGLGMIGAGVTTSLLRNGRATAVYDVRPDAAAKLEGAVVCGSPAEVAKKSDVVMVAVVNAEQARNVLSGPGGLSEGAHPGLVVVLLSTLAVPVIHELAAVARSHGIALVDCGISGGLHVAGGGGVCMAGGDAQTVESIRGVVEQFVTKLLYMGPQGTGMAAKICRNMMHYIACLGSYEAAKVAQAAGIDLQQLIQAVRISDPGNQMSTVFLERRGTAQPIAQGEKTFAPVEMIRGWANLLHKDLDAAAELAQSVAVTTPAATLAQKSGDAIYGLPAEPPAAAAAGATAGSAPATPPASNNGDSYTRGVRAMEIVYGPGNVPGLPPPGKLPPFLDKTLEHLFADVWMRPGLSLRDRRLVVLGATAALGRGDLIEIQTKGALHNQELTPAELQEAVLQLAYYVGWGNATSAFMGVTAAIQKAAAQPAAP